MSVRENMSDQNDRVSLMEPLLKPEIIEFRLREVSNNYSLIIRWEDDSLNLAYNDFWVSIGNEIYKRIDSKLTYFDLTDKQLMKLLDKYGKLNVDFLIKSDKKIWTYHLKTQEVIFFRKSIISHDTSLERRIPVLFELQSPKMATFQKQQQYTTIMKPGYTWKYKRDTSLKSTTENKTPSEPSAEEFRKALDNDRRTQPHQPSQTGDEDQLRKLHIENESLKHQLREMEHARNSLLDRNTKLEEFSGKLQEELKNFQASSNKIAQNDGFVQAVKAKNVKMQNDISRLKGNNDKLKESLRTLENTITDKDKENKRLQEIHTENRKTFQQFENDLKKYENELEHLKKALGEKQKKLLEYESVFKELKQENKAFRQENIDLKCRIQRLSAKLHVATGTDVLSWKD